VKGAAARLGVSAPTVYRLVSRGDLAAVRVGGAVRFDPVELGRFIAAGRLDDRSR
jgi:excisionase family DNA binding protein